MRPFESIFAVVCALLVARGVYSQCRGGWTYYGGSCYYVGEADQSFEDATDACEKADGYLARVGSAEENAFLKDIVRASGVSGAWIGAKEGRNGWDWSGGYGRREGFSFNDWSSSRRKRWFLGGGDGNDRRRSENCGAFDSNADYAWGQFDCGTSDGMGYVCETCPVQAECFGESCYMLTCNLYRWKEAEDRCYDLGGFIADIETEEENNDVKLLLNVEYKPASDFEPGVFVGATDEYNGEGNWEWYDKEEPLDSGFTYWSDNQPDNDFLGRDENCMIADPNDDWKWNDVSCDVSIHPVLCEFDAEENPISG